MTLVVTNVTKLAGLALGLHSGFSAHPSSVVLAEAAFMMAGAQVSEPVMVALLDRLLGSSPKPPPDASSREHGGQS